MRVGDPQYRVYWQRSAGWRRRRERDLANPQKPDAPEEEDPSSVMDFVPQVHMLVTEINPGDAGEASPLRVTGFMGGEAEFAVVPALYSELVFD